MASKEIEALLKACTVKVLSYGNTGTAFFVAPGLLLTCAHVVRGAAKRSLDIIWAKNGKSYTAHTFWISPNPEKVDIALLKVASEMPLHPCVYIDRAVEVGDEDYRVNDEVYSYGYMKTYPNGAGVTGKSEWLTGDSPPLMKFKGGQIESGLSGSALLNFKTGKVCGIVKETRSSTFPKGGGAVPISVAYRHLFDVIDLHRLQRDFHQNNADWQRCFEASLPNLPSLHWPNLKPNKGAASFILNYIFALAFLTALLLSWFFLGLWSKAEFPFGFLYELIKDYSKGPQHFSRSIDREQQNIAKLTRNVFKARRNSEADYDRLNKYEAKIAALGKIIDILYEPKAVEVINNRDPVNSIREELAVRRREIWVDLEPLREVYDPHLRKIENFFNTLYSSQAIEAQDYKHIRKIVSHLASAYSTEPTSRESVFELLAEMRQAIAVNPLTIRKSRLKLLEDTYNIMYWISLLEGNESVNSSFHRFNGLSSEITDEPAQFNSHNLDDLSSNLDNKAVLDTNQSLSDLWQSSEKISAQERNISLFERVFKNVESIARQLQVANKDTLTCFRKGIKNGWIEEICFYGFETTYSFESFYGHALHEVSNVRFSVQAGLNSVNKQKRLSDLERYQLNVSEETNKFNALVYARDLRVGWRVVLTDDVKADPILSTYVYSELGLIDAKPIIPRKVRAGVYGNVDPLVPEFSYELNFEDPS